MLFHQILFSSGSESSVAHKKTVSHVHTFQSSFNSSQADTISYRRCLDPCDRIIAGGDTHDRCVQCLGLQHAQATPLAQPRKSLPRPPPCIKVLARITNPTAADFATVSKMAEQGYVAMSVMEETLAAHLEPTSAPTWK